MIDDSGKWFINSTGLLFLSVERQDLYTAFGQIKITNDAMQKQEG